MKLFWTIVRAKLRMAGHAVASVRDESKLKVGVVTVFALLLWFGAFGMFLWGFHWLRGFGIDTTGNNFNLGDIIMVRLLAVFALALFLMLGFSNILIAYSTLYRSREVEFMLQSPVPIRSLFLAQFVECVTFSSWASAFLGSPLMLAYGISTHAPPAFYLAALMFYLPYIMIPAALGSILAIVLVHVFPKLPKGSLLLLGAVVLGLLFVYLRVRLDAIRMAQDTALAAIVDAMGQTQSSFLPSYWASHGVLAAADEAYGDSVYHFLLLLSNALMATWLAAEVAERLFYSGWSAIAGNSRSRVRPAGRGLAGWLEKQLRVLPNPARALVVKDIKLFWRDTTQWAQFVVFFGIMAIYVATIRPRFMNAESDAYRNWVVCLNIGACTLILASLTSRFVYPLVSLEGRRFWVLGLAPVTIRQIVWQKFWLSVITTSAFSIGLVVLSCIRLEVEPIPFSLAVYSICITNLALSGLAVGLGSLYPNFEESNPSRIVSGMGGTLNFLLSMGYIVLVIGAQTLILQWRVLGAFTRPEWFWYALAGVLVFVTALSVFTTVVPLRMGLRNLRAMEF